MNSPTLTRRRFLKHSFVFSTAMALGSRGRSLAADEIPAGDRNLLVLGDWGANPATAGTNQKGVADAMKGYVQSTRIKPEGMLFLGDNFYGDFPGGVKCPRWKTQYEDMYPAGIFPGPNWAILGNHDYEDGPDIAAACLAYKKENPTSRWNLPAKWYSFDFPEKDPLAKIIALDSNYSNTKISLTADEKAAQEKWLQAELEKPRTAPFVIVLGHHPIHSAGHTGENAPLIAAWEPLLKKHQAHFYFCGHDHDMMHLEIEGNPTSHVLSGGGGATLSDIVKPDFGPYAQSIFGFSHLQLSKERIIVRHLGPDQKQLHAFSKTPDGKVMILDQVPAAAKA